jgi:hypothetical protein
MYESLPCKLFNKLAFRRRRRHIQMSAETGTAWTAIQLSGPLKAEDVSPEMGQVTRRSRALPLV